MTAYKRRAEEWGAEDSRFAPAARSHLPLAHAPSPSPPMKTERTIDTIAVVTPNCAIDSRSHTNSYSTLQNPEAIKKKKYHFTPDLSGMGRVASDARSSAHSRLGMKSCEHIHRELHKLLLE